MVGGEGEECVVSYRVCPRPRGYVQHVPLVSAKRPRVSNTWSGMEVVCFRFCVVLNVVVFVVCRVCLRYVVGVGGMSCFLEKVRCL